MAPQSRYKRGTVVLDHRQVKTLVRAERRYLDSSQRRGPNAILSIAGVPLHPSDEVQHCKFIGITGSGKTTAISDLIGAAIARGDRAIIADPDGAYSQRFYRPERGDIIFNPFDAKSRQWDLFSEIQDDFDIEDLARSLIPDAPTSHDHEWREYARTFFTDVTQELWKKRRTNPAECTTAKLHEMLTRARPHVLRDLLAGTSSAPFLDPHAEKMLASIRGVTSSAVRAFKYVARQHGETLSIREWVRRGSKSGGVLFMPYRANEIEALRSTISAWMRLGIFEALNREEGDQRLWFVIDELGALGRIGGLVDGLTRLRKFGGRVVLGFQSIDQVEALYGKNDANAIVENCGNTLLLRCGTSDQGGTSAFASKLMGEREMERRQISRSYRGWTDLMGSRTDSPQIYTEHAVMAAEIEQLPNHSGYLRVSSRPEWMQVSVARPAEPTSRTPLTSPLKSFLKRISPFFGRGPPNAERSERQASSHFPDSRVSTVMEPSPSAYEANATETSSVRSVKGPVTRIIRTSAATEIYKHVDGSRAFERRGHTFTTPHDDAETIQDLITEVAQWRWKRIQVEGSPAFASAVWEAATDRNIEVLGYTPTPQQLAAQRERRKARPSLSAEPVAADAEPSDNRIRRAHRLDRPHLNFLWARATQYIKGALVSAQQRRPTPEATAVYEGPNLIDYREPDPHRHDPLPQAHSNVDRTTVPDKAVKGLFVRHENSDVYLHLDKRTEAFRDEGLRLSTRGEDLRVLHSLVQIAEARQWKAITVKGTEAFRRAVWLRAAQKGIDVAGYEPTHEDRAELNAAQERQRNAVIRQDTSPVHREPAQTAPQRATDSVSELRPTADPDKKRRHFSVDEKVRIVKEAENLTAVEQYEALLKREGITHLRLEGWAKYIKAHPELQRERTATVNPSDHGLAA